MNEKYENGGNIREMDILSQTKKDDLDDSVEMVNDPELESLFQQKKESSDLKVLKLDFNQNP